MSVLAKLLFLAAFGYLLFERLKTLLTYFQQEEYDGARFLAACRTIRLYDVRSSVAILIAFVVQLGGASGAAVLVGLALVVAVVAWRERRYRYKKPLVWTARAGRIRWLAGACLVPLAILSAQHVLIALVVIQLVPLALVAANAVLAPFQARINDRYIAEARAKLERMNPLRIGITGSFGKTTVKHMLADVMGASGPVFFSRGSINTVLGLTRHIRERLQWSHRYFIAEMGAYGEGSVQRLCEFAQPDFGIVTAVGDAHTERFGGIDAIARAKSELARDVCLRGGTVLINAAVLAHEPFARLREAHPGQVISVGTSDADVIASASASDNGTWTVSLQSSLPAMPDAQYEIPLLGEHNIVNSALAVSMALAIDADLRDDIPYMTREVAQVPHRLQRIDHPGQPLILDDAYNANEKGFKSAVQVLSSLAQKRGGRAVLVTPGITELGLEHDRVHARLGEYCNDRCNVVYAVNPERIGAFIAALDVERVHVVEVATFGEARRRIASDTSAQDVVLYENDLPDVLEEARWL